MQIVAKIIAEDRKGGTTFRAEEARHIYFYFLSHRISKKVSSNLELRSRLRSSLEARVTKRDIYCVIEDQVDLPVVGYGMGVRRSMHPSSAMNFRVVDLQREREKERRV